MKRSNDHTKAAILFTFGAIVLGAIIFAAIKFAGSISPQTTTASANTTKMTSDIANSAMSDPVNRAEVAQDVGNKEDSALPTDQDKVAMLAGTSFSDQVSSGNGYCYGEQITFDNIGTDYSSSVTFSNRSEEPDLTAKWDIRDGNLLLAISNQEEGNQSSEVMTLNLKVWANGKGEPNAKEMSESGQIQIGDSPILTFCRAG